MAILDYEPKQFIKGETVQWTRRFTDYPATTWTLIYYFRGRTHGFNVVATADGTDYLAAIPDISGKMAGVYQWQAFVEKTGEKYLVDSGSVEILPDLSEVDESESFDPRSQAEKDLEAVKSRLSGKATKDVMEYTIGNRSLKSIPIADLLELKKDLVAQVNSERRAKRRKKGGAFFKSVNVRLHDA